ncbi:MULTISPECIES: universal stress protein [Vibrio]|uniref:universal stress protein n=1 Tax=Vibrio TaxID=662 RepID=UPI0009343CEF|nr:MULTISPECIES: universal stress protein [Vibrio]EKO3721489.1 universal stress protein [Vibrio metschnikovii]EKO3722855.1 universal stress protein [Vibrio metschnikovii]PXA69917.1 universal stress protein [Vibrio sp. 11986-1-5]
MYKHILVPVDLNEQGFADKAAQSAVWQARHSGAQVHLLTVLPGIHMSMVATYFPRDAANKMKQDVAQRLQAFAQQYLPEDIHYQLHVAEGKPYTTILEYAEKLEAELIVMPSHKRSRMDKVMLGSVASKVVENAPIPVLVIKPQG